MNTTLTDDKFLNRIFSLINQAIIVSDCQGKIINISPNTDKVLGLKPSEIEDQHYIQNLYPKLKFNWQKLRKFKQIKNIELEVNDLKYRHLSLLIDIQLIDEDRQKVIYIIQNITRQKKIEKNLKFSEKIYAKIAQNLPLGIFHLDQKGNCVYANPKACEILGRKNQEPFIEYWLNNIVDQDKEKIFSYLADTLKTSKIWHDEYCYQYSDQEVKWLFTQCVPETNLLGEVNYIGTIIDITDRKKAELEVQNYYKTLTDFKYALDQATIVTITDHRGVITYVNEQFCNISQYSEVELIGKTHKIINSGYHSPQFFKNLWQTISQGKVWRGEVKNKAKDGSFFWSDTTIVPFLNEDNKPYQYLAIRTDITAKKKAEAELQKSEDRFKATFEQAAVGIAHVALDGRWLKVNHKLCEIIGYIPEELLNLTFQDITHPDDLNADLDQVYACIRGEINTYTMEKRYLKKDGNIVWVNLTVSLLTDKFQKPKYFISVVEDISKRKKIELELKESEERFRSAIDNAPFPIMIHAEDGEIIKINQVWSDITGYKYEEIPTIFEWTKKAYGKRMKIIQSVIDQLYSLTTRVDEGEFQITTKTGETRVWDFSSAPLGKIADGRRIVLSMAMDVTRRKQAELCYLKLNKELEKRVKERTQKFQESQEFLRLIINNIPQYIYWKDTNSVYLGCNEKYAEILGLENTEEIKGKTDYELPFVKEQIELDQVWEHSVIKEDKPFNHLIHSLTLNGQKIWLDSNIIPLHNSKGKVIGVLGCCEDITERRKIEQQLKLTQFTLDHLGDSVFFVQEDASLFYVNDAACEKLGYTKTELLSLKVMDINPLYFAESNQNWSNFWQGTQQVQSLVIEGFHRKKNGEFYPVEINIYHLQFEDKAYNCAIAKDITERKKAEQALKESEEKYRLMANNSTDLISRLSHDGVYLYASPACINLLGYQPEELEGKSAYDFFHPEDISLINNTHQSILNHPNVSTISYRIRRKDHQYIWFETKCKTVTDPQTGKVLEILAVSRDITARKKAEIALQESEQRYRRIVETANEGIWIIDMEAKTTYVNKKMTEVLGYSAQEMQGKSLFDFMDKDWEKICQEKIQRRRKGIKEKHDFKFICKDGSHLWCLISTSPIFDEQGNYEGALGMITDITDRIEAEEKLRYSEERFRIAISNSPLVVFNQDLDLRYTWIYNSTFNFTPEEIIGKSDSDIFSSEDAKKLILIKKQVINTGIGIRKEVTITTNNKRNFYDLTIEPLFSAQGKIEGITCAALDFTERKKAEIELAKTEHFIRILTDAIPDIIYIYDLKNQRNIYMNKSIVKNLGYSELEIKAIGENMFLELTYPEDLSKVCQHHEQLQQAKDQDILEIEYRLKDRDNNWHWFLSRDKIFMRDKEGKVTQIVGVASDISLRKENEIKLKQSLQEKEVLLKEIHHRVKNNLYVISSLLNLQANYLQDQTIISYFEDSKNRIQSMAMIHDQLYRSDNFASINFNQYITQLVHTLFNSYNPNPDGIKPDLNLDSIQLNIETAVPCGLLINELVANSFKHAFHQVKSGKVMIRLYSDSLGQIHLIIADNGQGFPPNLEWEKTDSLGLRLVKILCDQIDATLEFKTEKNKGTSFHFIFAV
jgi:PAS domain S-box-containing protein